jgi:hypothetical protein
MKLTLAVLLLLSANLMIGSAFGQRISPQWKIKFKNASDYYSKTGKDLEYQWGLFVSQMGEAIELGVYNGGCNSFDSCLRNKLANKYFDTQPAILMSASTNLFADCGDLPWALRGYFMFMNHMPWYLPKVKYADYANESYVDSRTGETLYRSIRYNKWGNAPRTPILIENGTNIVSFFRKNMDAISTANYRISHLNQGISTAFSPFYSPKITPAAIKPGTIIYDPAGHVLLVYKVRPNGKVYLFDGHPDNSITRKVYGQKFVISRPAYGAGFQKFRPIRLSGAKFQGGRYTGGRIKAWQNHDIGDFDLYQFYGELLGSAPSSVDDPRYSETWKNRTYLDKGGNRHNNEHDWVRMQLKLANTRLNILDEFNDNLDALCLDIKDRRVSVREATENKQMHTKAHPTSLPGNIYGTSGAWEAFSTPSRDARLKSFVREIRQSVLKHSQWLEQRPELIEYRVSHSLAQVYSGSLSGKNLKGDMQKILDYWKRKCATSYTDSNGSKTNINMKTVLARIYKLSFDPYHCPELRWGDTAHRSRCEGNGQKWLWYLAQQGLRNQLERRYDLQMDLNLKELRREWSDCNSGGTCHLSVSKRARPSLNIASAVDKLPGTSKSYVIQTGAYSNINNAEDLISNIKKALKSSSYKIYSYYLEDKKLYRLMVGPFESKKEADRFLSQKLKSVVPKGYSMEMDDFESWKAL